MKGGRRDGNDIIPGLGPRKGVPRLVPNVDWSPLLFDDKKGFVLSRIDGKTSLGDIILLVPFPETQTEGMLHDLFARGVIDIPGVARPRPPPGGPPPTPALPGAAPPPPTAPAVVPSAGAGAGRGKVPESIAWRPPASDGPPSRATPAAARPLIIPPAPSAPAAPSRPAAAPPGASERQAPPPEPPARGGAAPRPPIVPPPPATPATTAAPVRAAPGPAGPPGPGVPPPPAPLLTPSSVPAVSRVPLAPPPTRAAAAYAANGDPGAPRPAEVAPPSPPAPAPPPPDSRELSPAAKLRIEEMLLLVGDEGYAPDPHKLLDVPVGADRQTIKRAYRELAKEFHPDRHFGKNLGGYARALQRVFNAIKEAYDLLLRDATS